MEKKDSLLIFQKKFSNDEQRLWALFDARVENRRCLNNKCHGIVDQTYKRLKNKKALICAWCLLHVHPLVDEPFNHCKIKLEHLFEILYRFLASKNGISAEELKHMYGYSSNAMQYLLQRIRYQMGKCLQFHFSNTPVEIDETYISTGRKGFGRHYRFAQGREGHHHSSVLGIVERNGRCRLFKITSTSSDSIIPIIQEYVEKSCKIYTDEWKAYRKLRDYGYEHITINHSAKENRWKDGDACTNSAENVFSNLKRMITGTYRNVSDANLQSYCDEAAFRHSYRHEPDYGFSVFLKSLPLLKVIDNDRNDFLRKAV